MTVHIRTRVELTCWNLIIPAMTKLRYIRSTTKSQSTHVVSRKQAIKQVFTWAAAGLVTGFGLSIFQHLVR